MPAVIAHVEGCVWGLVQPSVAIQHHALVCENAHRGDFCSENRIFVSVPVLKQAQTQRCIAKGMLKMNYFKPCCMVGFVLGF